MSGFDILILTFPARGGLLPASCRTVPKGDCNNLSCLLMGDADESWHCCAEVLSTGLLLGARRCIKVPPQSQSWTWSCHISCA